MKLSATVLATSFCFTAAHVHDGVQHVPQLLGGRGLLEHLNMHQSQPHIARHAARKRGNLMERQGGVDGECGAGLGSCATGYCCSSAGWCGSGKEYCSAPDCQIDFGPACDGNQKPSGVDTSGVTRTKVSNGIMYGGAGIYDCVKPGDVAITYDDGPFIYTSEVLDTLARYGAKATFFMTGNNLGKGMINDPNTPWPALIKRMDAEGHQIASHTWSHENASQLTTTQLTNQMVWNEIALNSIIGKFPTYMRPPYSICPSSCETVMERLGYHVTYFDLDTEGYLHTLPSQIQTSKDIWDRAMLNAKPTADAYLHIEHEIHEQVAMNLTEYILKSLYKNGWKAVTVGECLGDPVANWYRTVSGSAAVPAVSSVATSSASRSSSSVTSSARSTSSTSSSSASVLPTASTAPTTPTTGLKVSTDGSCGTGITCKGSQFGDCCSQYGWCGSTVDHCGTSCNPAFGSCTSSSDSASSSSFASKSQSLISPSSIKTAGVVPSSSAANSASSVRSSSINAGSNVLAVSAPSSTTSRAAVTVSNPPVNSLSSTYTTSISTAVRTTSLALSTPTLVVATSLKVSTNGRCGNGVTCNGSWYGSCCGRSGTCGWLWSCLDGCQSAFGNCY